MTAEKLDYMTLDELIEVCLTDPAHIARVYSACAELDDMKRDWDMQVAELRAG